MDKTGIKYVNVQWAKAHEYKDGDIISMHGFNMVDDESYKVVSSKQIDRHTVELRVARNTDITDDSKQKI